MPKRQQRIPPLDAAGDSHDLSSELWDPQLRGAVRALLTSAMRCFAAYGYHATTTRDIAAGVGLSPAALYVHFPSKELVLYEIVRTGHERVLNQIKADWADDTLHAEARLRGLIAQYTAWHARHHVIARVCQYELSGLTAEHYNHIRDLRRETNEVFRHIVAAGVDDGAFAGADVNRVVRAMLSLSIDLVRWYRLGGDDSPEQLGEFYAELALRMVRAPGEEAATNRSRRSPAGRAANAAPKTAAKAAAKPARGVSRRTAAR